MKQGDLLHIVQESMALDEKVNPDNDEVNAIIRKYLKRKGTPTDKEQAILDKYGITYDKKSKQFFGPNNARVSGFDRDPSSFAKFNPEDYYGYGQSMKDEIDYANMLTKPRNRPADDYELIRNMQISSQDVKNYKRELEFQKHMLDDYMERYEKAVEEDDQDEMDFCSEAIGDIEERIDWYQKMIDYTMMFARQEHNGSVQKSKNESYRSKQGRRLKEEYSLVGQDGNAFSLMGYTARCMKECGLRDEIEEMRRRATSGDYNNLIMVCDEYIQRCNEIAGYDDEDYDDIDESCSKKPRRKVKESIEDYDEFYIDVDFDSATPFKDMLFTAMEEGDAETVGRELVSFISEDDAEYVCKILGFVE